MAPVILPLLAGYSYLSKAGISATCGRVEWPERIEMLGSAAVVRTTGIGALQPVVDHAANGRRCPRLCENTQEPRRRRSIFSIALFPIAATGVFFFRLTKSRKIFYAQIYCLCFHTGAPGDRQGVGGASPLR